MARPVAAAAPLLLGPLSLVPLRLCAPTLLSLCPGADAQVDPGFQLRQPQDKVSVAAGGTLTLNCTISGGIPAGPVKWLKGLDSGNVTVYDQTGSFPRVTRAVSGSDTDFTIHIRDVQPEDSGTYYCVKFIKSLHGGEEFWHGGGTEVSLYETSLVPGTVAAAVVLCFLLLGLFVAFFMYRRKRRGETERRCLDKPVAMGSFSPLMLWCCAGRPPSTLSEVLDAEASGLPSKQSSKEDNEIHYADLQPLPAAPRRGRSPGTACSEYASIRVDAK
ncbi:signal-regulatory protein delta-like isoform X2 [Patagioenas fasciata]|uniref:signal-regulatory protein delta-like isoform X2 n=1 Tax=Patagioenas fasciata TaxID=372321 RepID=UPI0032E8A195